MIRTNKQSGFTAVELLITLFVAAGFLVASYQLYNLIIKDGGSTRSESRASNVAYDYLRQYTASSTTIPCTASTPLTNAPLTIGGLSSVTMSITISCLPDAINSLSKVEATITYNNPSQTVTYATYVSSSGTSGAADNTDGLVAWWKLNGDPNNSIGSPNGVVANTTSTMGQLGQPDTAYSFNGTSSRINTASTFGLGTTNSTISLWVNNPTTNNRGAFMIVGDGGYGLGIGTANFDNASAAGPNLVMLYEGVRWIPTTRPVGTGWHHIAMVINGSGVPTGYVDGVVAACAACAGAGPNTPSGSLTAIGASPQATPRFFNGSIDDVRLYNRALAPTEIVALFSAGAK